MDFTQSIDLKILIEHNLWPAWHCEHCRNIPHEHLPARHDYVSALKQWHVLVAQSCPILCDPMNCSPPGSSVRVVLQTRTREWAAMPFSRGSSRTRDWTWVSYIAARFFTIWATRESPRNDIDPWKDDRERKAQWISKYKTEWSRKRRCSGGTVIWIFPWDVAENPNKLFGQTDTWCWQALQSRKDSSLEKEMEAMSGKRPA